MKGNGDAQIRIKKHHVQWRCGGLKLKHKLSGLNNLNLFSVYPTRNPSVRDESSLHCWL